MSTQYDAIGDTYVKTSPLDRLETLSMARVLDRVDGQRGLDLATGHGRGARLLVDQGAAHVVGIDVSSAMIQCAKQAHKNDPRLDFRVGDCSQVKEVEGGPFDIVTSIYLLNYAASQSQLRDMLRNMHLNLKPGGRVVALTNNVCASLHPPQESKYGAEMLSCTPIEDGGYKLFVRITADPNKKPYEFECYYLPRSVYERAAADAGLVDLQWRAYVIPEDETLPEDFWEVYKLRPHICILTARKPA